MKKFIAIILLLCSLVNLANADCDFSKGITPGPNHTYIYTEACHLKVAQLVQTNKTQAQQITDLNKAIQLKDLAISYSDQRVALWQKSSDDELQRLNTIESEQKHSDWLYFGLGVATTFLAAYGAAQLIHR